MKERKSIRLKGFDYGKDALYFITSVIKDREIFFGEMNSGRMILNQYGEIAGKQWFWLGQQYPYVVLHDFVVMPNHIHGIIEINRKNIDITAVGTGRDLSLLPKKSIKIKPLPQLIGAYKTTVSKQIHLAGNKNFAWQRSYHDHIIRNDNEYHRITNYIHNNPRNWNEDDLF